LVPASIVGGPPSGTGDDPIEFTRVLSQPGGPVYTVDALFMDDGGVDPYPVKLGITPEQLGAYSGRGQKTALAQFFDVVTNGLILARAIFKGLERPMCCDDDMDADERKLVYVLRPKFDAEWSGDRFNGGPARRAPPPGRVFLVIVTPNQLTGKDQYPDIAGWIEHWTWVLEDEDKSGKPTGYDERFNRQIWG